MDSSSTFSEFTEAAYREIIQALKAGGYAFSRFGEDLAGRRHVMLRHDVDQSPHRALLMARIEAEEGSVSTYFLLARSRFYNLAEPAVTRLVHQIIELGHDVGLHFDGEAYGTNVWTREELERALEKERVLLQTIIERPIEAVAYHNPDQSNLLDFAEETIGGLINAYCSRLRSDYAYASDSNGYWRFKSIPEVIAEGHERLCLLTHPEWWTPEPLSPSDRVDRCINGRARAARKYYDDFLAQAGRTNIGKR